MAAKLEGSDAENVLTLLCYSEEHCQELFYKLKLEHFVIRGLREIAERAMDFIRKHGKPPRAHLADILEDKIRRPDDHARFLRYVLSEMERIYADLNAEYVMSRLDLFIRTATIENAAGQALELAAKGRLEEAQAALLQASLGDRQAFDHGIWLHDTETMLGFLEKETDEEFSSGIKALDEKSLRPARKTAFMLMGPAKCGKSWYLIQCGKQAMLDYKNVLHVTLENSQEMSALRYLQSICGATARETRHLITTVFRENKDRRSGIEFTPENLAKHWGLRGLSRESEEKIREKLDIVKNHGRILIKEFPSGGLTVSQLWAYLDYLAQRENFRPDMVIVDYLDQMYTSADNLRIDTGRLTRDLRGLAVKRNIAMVTATQTNRQSLSASLISGGHVAEDWSKIGTVDVAISYNQTMKERKRNVARLFVAAARNAPDKWLALISQAYELGQFALDSVFFSDDVEQELEEFLKEPTAGTG